MNFPAPVCFHNCADKGGFACAHSATKGYNIASVERRNNLLRNLFQTVK